MLFKIPTWTLLKEILYRSICRKVADPWYILSIFLYLFLKVIVKYILDYY